MNKIFSELQNMDHQLTSVLSTMLKLRLVVFDIDEEAEVKRTSVSNNILADKMLRHQYRQNKLTGKRSFMDYFLTPFITGASFALSER